MKGGGNVVNVRRGHLLSDLIVTGQEKPVISMRRRRESSSLNFSTSGSVPRLLYPNLVIVKDRA